MDWKNLSLFGRKILDNDGYTVAKEIIRTQNFGVPAEPFKGAVMQRQEPERFKAAVSKFISEYKRIGEALIESADGLSPSEREQAVELLKRCEKLNGMAHTFSEVNEAFRSANVESGKDYAGLHMSMARRLEIACGGASRSQRSGHDVRAVHYQDPSFR